MWILDGHSSQNYDYYSMVKRETGHCLDFSEKYRLRAIDCNSTQWQEWPRRADTNGTGRWYILGSLGCGVLDASVEFGLRCFPENYSAWQRWSIISVY